MKQVIIVTVFGVVFSTSVARAQSSDATDPTDPAYYRTSEFLSSTALSRIGADVAYSLGFDGTGVLVAVLDTGIAPFHPELIGSIAGGYNTFTDDEIVEDFVDFSGHGTQVASVIMGHRDGLGMHGVAHGAQVLSFSNLMPLDQDAFTWANDIMLDGADELLAAGGRIVNNSWVTPLFFFPDFREPLFDEMQARVDEGAIFVFASGNFGDPYPWPLGDSPLHRPELQPGFIVVTAVGEDNENISMNACGSSAAWCISAPTNALAADVGVRGTDTYDPTGATGQYSNFGNTSGAAPFVSGTLALVEQAFPWMTSQQMVQTVLTTATDLGSPELFGHGLVNAGRAVQGPGSFDIDWVLDMDAHEAVWNNNIDGQHGLTLGGLGSLVLNGQNTYAGPTNVQQGFLSIGDNDHRDAFVTSDVFVAGSLDEESESFGVLIGTGQIRGDLVNQGHVSSVLGLSVDGNYTQTESGQLLVGSDTHGVLPFTVSGDAELDGIVSVIPTDAQIVARSGALVTARSISGQFSGFEPGEVSREDFERTFDARILLGYTPTTAQFSLQRDNMGVVPTAGFASLNFGRLASRGALARLLGDARLGPWADVSSDVGYLGGTGDRQSRVSAGQTLLLDGGQAFGFSLALTTGGTNEATASSDIRLLSGTMAVAQTWGRTSLGFGISLGQAWLSTTRNTALANVTGVPAQGTIVEGDISAMLIGAQLAAAHRVELGIMDMNLRAGLSHHILNRRSGTESGTSGFELAYQSGTQSETVANFNVDVVGKTAGNATPFLSADWDHVARRTGRQAAYGLAGTTSAGLVASGIGQARDIFTITAGLNIDLGFGELRVEGKQRMAKGENWRGFSVGLEARF